MLSNEGAWKVKTFLRLEIQITKEKLFLYQQKYTQDLLWKYDMLDYKSISTPMEINGRLYLIKGKDFKDATMYR